MTRPTHRLAWLIAAAGALAVGLLASTPAAGGEDGEEPAPPPPAKPAEPPKGEGEVYGGVPKDVEPWKGVGEPLQRWFLEKVEFKGAGRELPEPKGLKSVKLGLLAPLYGHPDMDLGTAMRDGMVLAVEEANAAGGHRGIPFEIVAKNDLPLWGASSNMIVQLAYDDEVWAILGSVEGNSTHILLRVALKIEIPIVNTADTDPTLNETNIPWIVRLMPDDRQQCYRLFRHCLEERGLRRLAVVRTNERYGRMGVAEFTDSLRRAGHPVVADLRFGRHGALPEGTVERLRALKADGVLLWGTGSDMGRAAKALRDGGIALPLFGPDRMVSAAFLKEAGAAAEGVVAAHFWDPEREEPVWTAFRGRFRKRFDHEPDAYAAYGYDGARFLLECIGKAGLNRARIRDAMFAVDSWDGGVTGPVRFDAAKNNLRPAILATRKDGKWVYGE